ncbi:bifunctional adenosylcobinamide kinase/adenosylcobinamide-phosphate guanylyltransferase [Sporosarcina pasteurii]|uniref:Adenosylcobinamide kinase n=1 Tax=Sporosarcina pasteurii TaxID=1474 RepID=A0A380BDA5_SPOPA|nr:bifunctional adenosylcobinamide kinase/adenosylcobinamide-phosphate guanylyltransferase [Sporosarcina pasteurii]MDS9472314.1 bifunctional adenosylcobinamide kinase/adenosylcobinamide-phosphate guanylyltransferase [Sporosarcina pasteurii]QBQ06294.1 bifunctional adenosylcobinamide kinase/adenosylcobinamide-phosphate guanylyltransferase [Sporosarcina pasteurii]SUI99064.1 Adenosylcobinamide kinase [Sporosarcina pasteurii]
MVRGQLTFISGGVRSGKSAYAEKLLTDASQGKQGRLVYIASGLPTDEEMSERIQKHQEDRANFNWTTIEQPVDFEQVLPLIQTGDYILWDCLTTWLANELYVGYETGTPCVNRLDCMEQKVEDLIDSIDAILKKASNLVIVSNEVLHDVAPNEGETEKYRAWIGEIHQKIVAKAQTAIEMDSGIPIFWKGERA